MIRVQRVAASPKTSLRGETVPPANTSGAMKRGVPIPDRAARVLLGELARDAEVHEHDAAAAVDQVLRLHVAVDDLLLVHVLERLAGVRRT